MSRCGRLHDIPPSAAGQAAQPQPSENRSAAPRALPVGLAALVVALFLLALSVVILDTLGIVGLVIIAGIVAAGAVVARDLLRRRPVH